MYAAVLNSCSTAAAAGGDEEYERFFVQLEEGRLVARRAPAAASALADDDDDAAAASGHPLGRAWKIAMRSIAVAGTLAAEALVASLVRICRGWSDVGVVLVTMLLVLMIGAMVGAFTLDCFFDPNYHRRRRRNCNHS